MQDIIKDFDRINKLTSPKLPEAEKPSKEKTSTSDAANNSATSLDPKIARRVVESIVEYQEALEYLKNH